MERGGQAGGGKRTEFALAAPVGGVQVCAKAGNLFGSIRRSEAEAQIGLFAPPGSLDHGYSPPPTPPVFIKVL